MNTIAWAWTNSGEAKLDRPIANWVEKNVHLLRVFRVRQRDFLRDIAFKTGQGLREQRPHFFVFDDRAQGVIGAQMLLAQTKYLKSGVVHLVSVADGTVWTPSPVDASDSSPRWLADGSGLVFHAGRGEDGSGPRLVDPDGGSVDMPKRTVLITAPSRLHFGMLSFGHAEERQFGGVGAMIDAPGLRLPARG